MIRAIPVPIHSWKTLFSHLGLMSISPPRLDGRKLLTPLPSRNDSSHNRTQLMNMKFEVDEKFQMIRVRTFDGCVFESRALSGFWELILFLFLLLRDVWETLQKNVHIAASGFSIWKKIFYSLWNEFTLSLNLSFRVVSSF